MKQEMTVRVSAPSKLPINCFLQWLRQEISEGHISIDFSHHPHQYVSDMISDAEVESWHPEVPVMISTQTGTGKNHFIQNKLLGRLVENSYHHSESPARMLVLSNRIALNRQSKENFAQSILAVSGSTSAVEELKEQLTAEGIDHKTNFGIVDIYSYHQFRKAKPLRNKKYQYIVCDECHFFTSDGLFNSETHEILHEIIFGGASAIRIYMSATPDVASEAIIRQEYAKFSEHIDALKKENHRFKDGADVRIARISAYAQNDTARLNYYSNPSIDRRFKDELKTIYPFRFRFYYGNRDYGYINRIFTYKKLEELVDSITDSKNKWLIFVASETDGKQLMEQIRKKNVVSEDDTKSCCAYLSRNAVDNNKDAKNIYDNLIQKGKFDTKVLITTALLDNGINIEDKDVNNIVIDVFDRTSFIQMLGRIRVKKNTQITLYVRDYSHDDLKKLLRRKESDLLDRLNNDLLTVDERKERFDQRKFFYTDDPNSFSAYNPCAIYQLIDSINRILCLLKRNEDAYWNDTISALRTKIYNYYKFNSNGKSNSWSRSVVDILESSDGERWRENERENDAIWGEFSDRYAYHFEDSFTRFIFSTLIPNYYLSHIEKMAKQELDAQNHILSDIQRNQFHLWIQQFYPDYYDKTFYEQLQHLTAFMSFKKWGLPINFEMLENLEKEAKKSRDFAELQPMDSVQEQLMWIERPYASTSKIQSVLSAPGNQEGLTDVHKEWILKHSVSIQEIERHRQHTRRGENSKYYSYDALKDHGILKDSDEDSEFAQRCFGKEHLTQCLNKVVEIEDKEYTLKSFIANGEKHPVFYLFLKKVEQNSTK